MGTFFQTHLQAFILSEIWLFYEYLELLIELTDFDMLRAKMKLLTWGIWIWCHFSPFIRLKRFKIIQLCIAELEFCLALELLSPYSYLDRDMSIWLSSILSVSVANDILYKMLVEKQNIKTKFSSPANRSLLASCLTTTFSFLLNKKF